MPLPGYHACEIRPLSDFEKDSIRTIKRKHEGKEYSVLIGKLKDETTTAEHSYHYDETVWAVGEAKMHCEDHDGTFEKAAEDKKDTKIMGKRPKRSIFKPRAMGTYKVDAATEKEEAIVYLYDEISFFGIDAETFVKDLNALTAKTIHLRVNSPGGSVFDGIAIYNAIKQHKSRIIAHIDGLAASIASVIVMGADEIRAAESAFMMIHRPWSIVIGDAEMMRQEADLLDKVGSTIIKIYGDKSGKAHDEIMDMMGAETWFTGMEALENGFVDSIEEIEEDKKAKVATFDLSVFANVPDGLATGKTPPTERELEQILRDAGCSKKMAKIILATGFPENLRDVDTEGEDQSVEAQDRRDVDPATQRDVEQPAIIKESGLTRTKELLNKGEKMGFF